MVAALPNWIHDTSMDQRYVDHWNKATKPERAKLLKEAHCDPHYRHITWAFVPEGTRVDVQFVMDRQAKQPSPPPKKITKPPLTERQQWWNKY
jgi:hypothetical protein